METSALNIGNAQIKLLHFIIKEANEQFICICTFLFYIISGMSSRESTNTNLEEIIIFWGFFHIKMENGFSTCTTGTTNKNFALVFTVKIQKISACHKTGFHATCTGKLCFLITSKNTFQRSVFYAIIFQNSKFHSNSNAIICTKSCTFCL